MRLLWEEWLVCWSREDESRTEDLQGITTAVSARAWAAPAEMERGRCSPDIFGGGTVCTSDKLDVEVNQREGPRIKAGVELKTGILKPDRSLATQNTSMNCLWWPQFHRFYPQEVFWVKGEKTGFTILWIWLYYNLNTPHMDSLTPVILSHWGLQDSRKSCTEQLHLIPAVPQV